MFDEDAYREQTESLRRQLTWLRKTKQWRKFRRFMYECGRCHTPLLEVIETRPYPVVVYRRAEANILTDTTITSYAAWKAAGLNHRVRTGDPMFSPFDAGDLQALSKDRTEILLTSCACRQWQTTMAVVAADLLSGKTRRTILVQKRGTEDQED